MSDTGRRYPFAPPNPMEDGKTPPPPGTPLPLGMAPTSASGTGDGAPRPPLIADDASLEAGTMLGKYQIVQRLGSGGMGSVYEAIHTGISKPVALKTLASRLASDSQAQARFLREAASASRLTHPHVVDVIDFGSDGGITFLVMELLRGEELSAQIAREPRGVPVDMTADIMLAVSAGVFAAHEVGVIHRDLKPQNIFLARTHIGEIVPKVLDFGISKLLDEKLSQTLTSTGTVMGTTPYLSPEQVAGRPIDARSDQYTLGVILYECALGRRPHEGDTLFNIMRSIADGRFTRPRDIRPDLPPAFELLIMRAMHADPNKRYESVYQLGQALLPFASHKRGLMWADYFGGQRGAAATAPLPLPQKAGPLAKNIRPFDPPLVNTHTRGQKNQLDSGPNVYEGEITEPRRRGGAGTFLVVLVLMAGLGAGAWAYLRPARHASRRQAEAPSVEVVAPEIVVPPHIDPPPVETKPIVAPPPEQALPPPSAGAEEQSTPSKPPKTGRPGHSSHPSSGSKPHGTHPTKPAAPGGTAPILD